MHHDGRLTSAPMSGTATQGAQRSRRGKPKAVTLRLVESVKTDPSRDALLNRFSARRRRSLTAICCRVESYQYMFARVAIAYADDLPHAQRL